MKFTYKAGLAMAAFSAHLACSAANFPSQPVTIVVPYSAGQIDVFTRALAKGLADEWKQPVIVDNRAGGNEAVGADIVARAAPTGYTILIGTEASYVLNPLLFKKLSYNPQTQLAPVSLVVRAPLVFLAGPRSAANSMKEFVDMAKSRTNDPVRYGSSGVGGVTHLPYAALARDHGLTLVHVPYKGGAAVMQDLVANHIESALLGAGLVAESVKLGRLKALGVSAPKRISALPNVPTLEEQGIPDINAAYILGLAVPTGTPADVIDKIAATARKVVSTPEFRAAYLEPMGFSAVGSDPKEFADYLRQERPRAEQRVKDSGAQLEM